MLSLQGTELHYLIVGTSSEENPSIQVIHLDEKEGLKQFDALKNSHFKSVILTYYSDQKTLVPEGMFEEEAASNYLDFIYSEDSVKGLTTNDYIQQLESHLIYLEKDEINKIKASFPEVRIKHAVSVLLEAHMRSTIATESIEVTVFGQENKIEVIASNGKKLLLNNSFNVFNPEDFTYYIVYVMDVLGISLKETPVRVCGEVDEKSFSLLKKYCAKAGHHRFGYDPNMGKNIPSDQYAQEAVLINQYQCV